MSKKRQDTFSFTTKNLAIAKESIAKYPEGRQRSAVLPLLDLAQQQNDGWLSRQAIEYVAQMLELPVIQVYEVASFYSMFNLQPIGKHHLQICGTTPCWLNGATDIIDACSNEIGIKCGQTSKDGKFTISEVECLGSCVNAPVMQVNNKDYYENLTPDKVRDMIKKMMG